MALDDRDLERVAQSFREVVEGLVSARQRHLLSFLREKGIYAGVDPASDEGDYSSTVVKVQNEDGSWTDISGNIKSFKLDLSGKSERIFEPGKLSEAMHEVREQYIRDMKDERSPLWDHLVSRGLIQEEKKMETTNTPSKRSRIDTDDVRYAAKVYRTEIMENEIEHHIEVMLTSLAGEGKQIHVREDPTACEDWAKQKGLKRGCSEYNHKWIATCDKWLRTGRTRAGALASLLSCLLDGPFYPRT